MPIVLRFNFDNVMDFARGYMVYRYAMARATVDGELVTVYQDMAAWDAGEDRKLLIGTERGFRHGSSAVDAIAILPLLWVSPVLPCSQISRRRRRRRCPEAI